MKLSSGPRKTAYLSESVTHHLNMYALAAGTAGVAAVALAQPAGARIVYTPTHVTIPCCNPFPLDLNHDGVNDLSFTWNYSTRGSSLRLAGVQPNAVIGYHVRQTGFASALKGGVRVGPKGRFVGASFAVMFGNNSGNYAGQWTDVKNRYLGVKFSSRKKTHFGWVRLNVSHTPPTGIDAVITGYAYETIAGKSIITGKTKGPDDGAEQTATAPATLGRLALGRK